jgi:hypothetical protein
MSIKSILVKAALLVLVGIAFASCSSSREQSQETPTQLSTIPTPVPTHIHDEVEKETQDSNIDLSAGYSFPAKIDPTNHYLFYLHGKIIEDQGLPAISPEFGEYQYAEILDAFENSGFVVISEQRLKDTDGTEYAQKITAQVDELLNAGVAPGSITVVGASKGAAITSTVSNMMSNSELNYVLLGGCYQPLIDDWMQQGLSLSGNVLAIYDSSDEYASSCQDWFDFSDGKGLGRQSEIVLQVGTGHGILYEPLPGWVSPTVQWAKQEW